MLSSLKAAVSVVTVALCFSSAAAMSDMSDCACPDKATLQQEVAALLNDLDCQHTADCAGMGYCSSNAGKCRMPKMSNGYCNVVQQCAPGLQCHANTCVPPSACDWSSAEQDTESSVMLLPLEAAHTLWMNGCFEMVVDVRASEAFTTNEGQDLTGYNQEHIPMAKSVAGLAGNAALAAPLATSCSDQPILVNCWSGVLSLQGARHMANAGLSTIYSIKDAGIIDWVAAGYPTEMGVYEPTDPEFCEGPVGPTGYWYSYPEAELPAVCQGAVGQTVDASCCMDGALPPDIENDTIDLECAEDQFVPGYFSGTTCTPLGLVLRDDCDDSCGTCVDNIPLPPGSCVYTAPLEGLEWLVWTKPGFHC